VPAAPPRGAGAFARVRPARPPTAAPTTPAATTRVAPETVARIVGRFEGLGTLEAGVEAVGATALVALVEPGISRMAVTGCARGLARFLTGDGDVATVRTAHAVVAVAVGPAATVVAGRRPGPSAALLELRVGAAAAQLGAGVRSAPAPSRRALVPLAVDARVTGAGAALGSFGPLESAVFGDGGTRLYVFSARGRDAAALGAFALDVLDAIGNVTGELGRLVSVMFRRGPDRTLVRPLAGGATVLAVAGPVTRPGRIRADTDRAVAMLEAV
jgi:hypothetical protein